MDNTFTYQCAIIGGGLAGLTLAIQLQQAGVKTILFEKEQYPFHKVCGEYISMESWGFLERIGLPLSNMKLPRITRLNITAPNGNKLSHELGMGGFGISRYTLDFELYLLAKKAGVVVKENCRVNDVDRHSIHTSEGFYKANMVIGTWGKRSRMDANLVRDFQKPGNRRLNNYVGVKYHVKADLPDDLIELHNFSSGYCGISKVDGDRYCLCYLVHGNELKKVNGSISLLEKKVLQQNPFLKEYLETFPSLYEKPLTISQVSFEPKTTSEQNILMAGDAAGLIAPLCGNGMSMAMNASYLLAEQLILHVEGKQTFEKAKAVYEAQWQQVFGRRLRTGRLIQSLFGHKQLTNLTITALKPFPFLLDQLIKRTHGEPF